MPIEKLYVPMYTTVAQWLLMGREKVREEGADNFVMLACVGAVIPGLYCTLFGASSYLSKVWGE